MPKKRETFFLVRNLFYPIHVREFPKKIGKKSKKLKNIFLDSFRVETSRDRLKKSEKVFLICNRFYPTRAIEFTKNRRNIQKIKKHLPGFISFRNGSGQVEKERKKFSRLEPFLPDTSDRFPKKIAKKFKKLKNIILDSFQAKTGWDRLKKRKFFFLVWNCFFLTRA